MKRKYVVAFGQIVIYIMCFCFFTQVFPIIPYDGDDWYFIGAMRKPYPLWGINNPIKVLPEVLEPLTGYIAAFVIYPVTGDYVFSISIAEAGILSLFIAVFCFLFYRFLVKRMKLTEMQGFAVEALFFLIFFIVFKEYGRESYFGFWSSDANCYFNYVIPGLLNASLVLWMAQVSDFSKYYSELSALKKGMFIVAVYFSIFSSIQLNIILAGYCSWLIIEKSADQIFVKKSFNVIRTVKELWVCFAIEIVWLISLLFESQGRRAGMFSGSISFQKIFDVIEQFIQLGKQVNRSLLLSMVVVFVGTIFLLCQKKNSSIRQLFIGWLYLIFLTTIYLTLIYTKTGGGYAARPDATWAILFYVLSLFQICVAFLLIQLPSLKCLMPIAIMSVFLTATNQNYRYMSYNMDYKTCKAVDEYIINQIIAADEAGLSMVNVKVPKENNETNWPHPYNMAGWLQNTLYSHGIIKTRLKIVFVPDDSVNAMFYTYDKYKMEPFIDFEAP